MKSSPGPQEAAEFADLLTSLQERLDETARQILQLMLEGYPQIEIAEQVGVTSRTVRRKQQLIRDEVLRLSDA